MGVAVGDVAHDQFGGDVLAIGGAAAVAEQHKLVAGPDGFGADADEPGKRLHQRLAGGVQGRLVLIELGFVKGVQVHGLFYSV